MTTQENHPHLSHSSCLKPFSSLFFMFSHLFLFISLDTVSTHCLVCIFVPCYCLSAPLIPQHHGSNPSVCLLIMPRHVTKTHNQLIYTMHIAHVCQFAIEDSVLFQTPVTQQVIHTSQPQHILFKKNTTAITLTLPSNFHQCLT